MSNKEHKNGHWCYLQYGKEHYRGAATRYTPRMGHEQTGGGTYACNGYAPKGCGGANPNGSAAIGVKYDNNVFSHLAVRIFYIRWQHLIFIYCSAM